MGNMLPACLVHHQQGITTAPSPAMKKPRQGLISLQLLVKAVHKLKRKRRLGSNDGGNKLQDNNKIDNKSSPSSPATAAHVEIGGGGGDMAEAMRKLRSNPKGNVLRSRLHAGGGGHSNKKGVVRVKVVLTKEEAARLLKLTTVGGGGGQKTAAQIVAEIKRMELRRRARSNAAAAAAWRPALESIPEESS